MAIEQDAVALSCFAINRLGDGQHPEATPANIHLFKNKYVRKCLQRVVNHPDTTGEAKGLATQILKFMPK